MCSEKPAGYIIPSQPSARYAHEYVLCRFDSKTSQQYRAKHICKEDIMRNMKLNTNKMFEKYGTEINLDYYLHGGVAKTGDFYYTTNIPIITRNMSKDSIKLIDENVELNEHAVEKEERNTKSGFIEIEGMEGCMNWEEVDMQDPKYDEHTRFIKTLQVCTWSLSDWYPNDTKFRHDNIYRILPKMAPYATKLYGSYGSNICDYARFGKHTIEYIAQNKRFYLEHVFNDKESNEYDKMLAASLILREFIMWSENDDYHDQCVEAIKGYYTDFFQRNRKYLVNSRDLAKWDELVRE